MSLIVNPHFIGVIDFGDPGTFKRIKPLDTFRDLVKFIHKIKDSSYLKEMKFNEKEKIIFPQSKRK